MATSNDSMTEGLAQIAQEEAAFGYGINRYFLGIVSIGLFFGGLYIVATGYGDSPMDQRFFSKFGPILMVFGVLTTFGAWRVNIIYKKLKVLESKQNKK